MRKQLIAVVVACVMATTGLQLFGGVGQARADDPPANPGYNCSADVLFVGLRGSGQADNDYDGLGDTVVKQRDIIKSQLEAKGRTLTTVAIKDPDYPALPVSDLWDPAHPTETNAYNYFRGVRSARDALQSFFNKWADDPACAKQRLVLSGYSQGAMVVHQFLNLIGGAPADRIDSVILIADPGCVHEDGVRTGPERTGRRVVAARKTVTA